MLLCGFKPNYVTIASILPLCARVAKLQHGKFSEAKQLFDSLNRKDVVTYTSSITGYGILEGEVALKLFEEMKGSGIKPDHITLVAVLAACSHSGLIIQGQLMFEKMWHLYGIRPLVEHYACMVDLFGGAGLLRKAVEIIRRMPYQPTADMWATLVRACHIHRNTDLGEFAAEKLLEMILCVDC